MCAYSAEHGQCANTAYGRSEHTAISRQARFTTRHFLQRCVVAYIDTPSLVKQLTARAVVPLLSFSPPLPPSSVPGRRLVAALPSRQRRPSVLSVLRLRCPCRRLSFALCLSFFLYAVQPFWFAWCTRLFCSSAPASSSDRRSVSSLAPEAVASDSGNALRVETWVDTWQKEGGILHHPERLSASLQDLRDQWPSLALAAPKDLVNVARLLGQTSRRKSAGNRGQTPEQAWWRGLAVLEELTEPEPSDDQGSEEEDERGEGDVEVKDESEVEEQPPDPDPRPPSQTVRRNLTPSLTSPPGRARVRAAVIRTQTARMAISDDETFIIEHLLAQPGDSVTDDDMLDLTEPAQQFNTEQRLEQKQAVTFAPLSPFRSAYPNDMQPPPPLSAAIRRTHSDGSVRAGSYQPTAVTPTLSWSCPTVSAATAQPPERGVHVPPVQQAPSVLVLQQVL